MDNIVFFGFIGVTLNLFSSMDIQGEVSSSLITAQMNLRLTISLVFTVTMYLFNVVMTVINSVRINKDKATFYFPKIGFIRNLH